MARSNKSKKRDPATKAKQSPMKICRSSNRCYHRNIFSPNVGGDDRNDGNLPAESTQSTIHHYLSSEEKSEVYQKMFHWKMNGNKINQSPIASLCAKFKCHRNYPGKLFKLVQKRCTVENQWNKQGRPKVFGPELRDQILKIVQNNSEIHELSPAHKIRATLMKQIRGKIVPCETTIRKIKREMKFRIVSVKTKPLLKKDMMVLRLKYVKEWHYTHC